MATEWAYTSATVWQGKIYVMGKLDLSGEVCTNWLGRPIEFWSKVYDPETDLWTALPNFTKPRLLEETYCFEMCYYCQGMTASSLWLTGSLQQWTTATMRCWERIASGGGTSSMVKSVLTLTTVSPTPSSPPLVAQLETQMMKLLKTWPSGRQWSMAVICQYFSIRNSCGNNFFKKNTPATWFYCSHSSTLWMTNILIKLHPLILSYFNIMIKVHTVVGSYRDNTTWKH